jgi:NAD(P)-dependent dehydrogenase (short-subunit alcohol dehydrogenase family)
VPIYRCKTANSEENMSEEALKAGDVVVITGAAQGIGRAIAVRLAKVGIRLALWDVLDAGLKETAEQCRKAGSEVHASRVDMADRSKIESAARAVLAQLGTPFSVINNAAIFPRSFIVDTDPDEWDRVLRINLTAPFLLTKLLAPSMMAAKRGVVINVASTVGLRGDPRGAHYASSKAGLMALTKSYAQALGPSGIRVNCVLPGISDTAQPLGDMTREELLSKGKDIPLGRIGEAEDTAGMVAFLLGPDATYVSGQSIAINGAAMAVP